MCLFDLVKQYHTVGAAAHGLGELAAFVMTQIARRCPQQAGSGVLFLILRHIELEQGLLAAKPAHGKCTGQRCFAYPGGAEEEHGPDGPTRLSQPGAAARRASNFSSRSRSCSLTRSAGTPLACATTRAMSSWVSTG